MTPDQIKSAVELAIQGKLSLPWWAYFFCFIITAVSAFLGAYLKVKAENFATREDFEKIIEQLKIQVAATEQIRSDVSFNNWKNQEKNSILRKKLEELVGYAFELRKIARDDIEKLGRDLHTSASTSFDSESEAILKMEMLSLLYFPELKIEALETNINFRRLQQEVALSNRTAKEIINKQLTQQLSQEDLIRLNSLNEKIPSLNQEFIESLNKLSSKAEQVLTTLMKI